MIRFWLLRTAISMELDFDDTVARGLLWYVRTITDALGLSPQSAVVQTETPADAYVALDGRLPDFPDLDIALLWDERRGWSIAVESEQELRRVADFGDERWPNPRDVAGWVRAHGVAPRSAIGGER